MRSPLIQQLVDIHQFDVVTEDTLDAFVQGHKDVVLFFTENPKHFPESNDVAVILPELLTQYQGRLTAALVAADSERVLHKRYGFNAWPALVFLRDGEYVGVITGMQNWSEFKLEFDRMLHSAPRTPPSFTIPVLVSAGGCDG